MEEMFTTKFIMSSSIPIVLLLVLFIIPTIHSYTSYIKPARTTVATATTTTTTTTTKTHVVILSHGFVGSSNDLTYLKDAIVREAGSGIQTQADPVVNPEIPIP